MQFDKQLAEQKLNEMIAQHPAALDGCGEPEIANYLETAPFAVAIAKYYGLDKTLVVMALICFDFEWGERFFDLYERKPTNFDWSASYFDRANAFADEIRALKPYDNPAAQMRTEYHDLC
jgi:hypothetical protein